MYRLLPFILIFYFSFFVHRASAEPFDDCPENGFLIQGAQARMYGVNIATGYYQTLSDDLGTLSKINALGFSTHDGYIYGYGSQWKSLIRINRLFQIEPIAVSNAPDTGFYVGDVSLTENKYFVYRPGRDFGLYSISLDPNSRDYLSYSRVVSGADLNLAIYDFAFHPSKNLLYTVSRHGELISINPTNGNYENLGQTGETGTFGAVYFDSNDFFYISRNSDGHIFRIDLNASMPKAEFFAFGPSSSNNDGARCAQADIISENSSIDFGNAPASYGSDIHNNGARHGVSEGLFIGSSWGGSDDGVKLITNIEPGLTSIMTIQVKGEGYINAWGDWDGNGSFDDSEQFISDQVSNNGANIVQVLVAESAKKGQTWGRVRLSSQSGIGPNGGVSDGEVEDFTFDVLEAGTSVVHYPSNTGFVTLAYEDNWPIVGDYDMNDVVVTLRTSQYSSPDSITQRYEVHGKVMALGAGYHNGFAIQFDGIPTKSIDVENSSLHINGVKKEYGFIEDNGAMDDAVLVISEDLKRELPVIESCHYYRTEVMCEKFEDNEEFVFIAVISFLDDIHLDDSPKNVLNPFIFASPGTYHGDSFLFPPGRELEIHLKNKKFSSQFNTMFMGLNDDRSLPGGVTFATENGMPWALEMPGVWSHPIEKQDLLFAYPGFKGFVESGGVDNKDWYDPINQKSNLVIKNILEK